MKMKINLRLFFIIFILIPFFKPVGIEDISFLNTIFLGWKIISLMLIFLILLHNNTIHFNRKYIGFYIYFIIVFIHDFINNYDYITPLECLLFFYLLSNYISYLCNNGNSKNLVNAVSFISIVYVILHLLSIVLVENLGISFHHKDYYLLGFDNYSAFFIIPLLTLYLYKSDLNNSLYSIKNIILIVIVAYSYFYTNSVTAMFSIVFFILLYLLSKLKPKISNIKSKKIILISIVFLILVVCFNIQNYFSSFFSTVEKDLTFDFRTYFWNIGLEMLKSKPLFGYGDIYGYYYKFYLGLTGHAHNMIFELLFTGGIVGLILYLYSFIRINNYTFYERKKRSINILNIGLIAFLVLGLMDFYPTMLPIYLLLLFVDNDELLKNNYKIGDDKNDS